MNMRTLFAAVMAVMLLTGGLAAFAGGSLAAENAEFDGEAVDASDAINTTYLGAGESGNVTIAMTSSQSVSAGGSVTYTSNVHPDSVSVNSSSGSGTLSASVDANGDLLVEETGGTDSATVDELHVTYDHAQFPYVLPSDQAVATDENYTGTSSVGFNSQSTDGERLSLNAAHNGSYFIVVHEVDDNGNPITENSDGEDVNVGVSSELTGEYSNVNVDLDEPVDSDTELAVMLHQSDDGDVGAAIEDDSSNIVQASSQLSVNDVVMTSESDLLVGPGTETQSYMVYHPGMVMDASVSTTNGELNESEYEPENFGESGEYTVTFERSSTYENVSLDSLFVEVGMDTIAFDDISEETEESSDSFVLDQISERDDQKVYKFEVLNPGASDEYNVTINATVNQVDAQEALSADGVPDPTGGAESDGETVSYSISAAGGAPNFFDVGDFGTFELLIGAAALLLLVGGIFYARDDSGQMAMGGYGAYMGSWMNGLNILWVGGLVVGVTMMIDYFTDINFWSDLVVNGGIAELPEITPLIVGAAIVVVTISINIRNSAEV